MSILTYCASELHKEMIRHTKNKPRTFSEVPLHNKLTTLLQNLYNVCITLNPLANTTESYYTNKTTGNDEDDKNFKFESDTSNNCSSSR